MMTTLLTLGMLVFSTTQAISSFGIVFGKRHFRRLPAFAVSDADQKKRKKDDEKTIILARLRATRRLIAGRLQLFAAGAARPPAGVAGTGYARHVAAARYLAGHQLAAVAHRQLQRPKPSRCWSCSMPMIKSSRWRVCHPSVSACSR